MNDDAYQERSSCTQFLQQPKISSFLSPQNTHFHGNVNFHKFLIRERERDRKRTHFMASSKLQALWNHPAGPKTIHFWAPTFKWSLIIANASEFTTPPENLSYYQQGALGCSGLIWSRYSTIITPRNLNMFGVNFAMAGTCFFQISRKIRQDFFQEKEAILAKEG